MMVIIHTGINACPVMENYIFLRLTHNFLSVWTSTVDPPSGKHGLYFLCLFHAISMTT